jgi:HNH endonuclease/AP2 domain
MSKTELTQERLHSLLDYDRATGIFRWKVPPPPRSSRKADVGDVAGYRLGEYVGIFIDGRTYFAHVLAWFYVHGVWAPDDIDHIDLDKAHNAIDNLRPATRSLNMANAAKHRDNASGYKGVSWHRRQRRWNARVTKNGKTINLGSYETAQDAHEVYMGAAKHLFGEFARAA